MSGEIAGHAKSNMADASSPEGIAEDRALRHGMLKERLMMRRLTVSRLGCAACNTGVDSRASSIDA